jgi:2'-5' RNA ligase
MTRAPRRDGIRCFVAVDLASDVRTRIEAAGATLRAAGADVRWVRAENLHVTLKFLGSVPPGRIDAIRRVLTGIAGMTRPFPLTASGLGTFPTARRARVVWVGLSGPALGTVARLVDDGLAAEGFDREARAFTPHVTIGRVRSQRGWNGVVAAMDPLREQVFGESRIDEIVLYRSDLHPEGARYTPVDRFRCGSTEDPATPG